MDQQMILRDEVRPGDGEIVFRLCQSSGFFSPAEVEVAVEMAEERLAKGGRSGYHFLFAEEEGSVLGYACYGPIPFTESSWDLYWLVVDDRNRGQGVGRKLQAEAEKRMGLGGGRQVYIYTSSRDQYLPTRRFHERRGYCQEATLRDYYNPGEHLIIFVKRLS